MSKATTKADTEARSFRSVWEDLSNVDCSDHVEVKNMGSTKLTYLSWAWAWGIMMTKYPNLHVLWMDPSKEGGEQGVIYSPNGTAMVHCRVVIPVDPAATSYNGHEDLSREMWLPVMDHKNSAITNPDTRQISDTKMRCLVKCFALYGLGHYIYAGEDLPNDPLKERQIEDHIKTIRAHSVTLKEDLGGHLPKDFVDDMKEAILGRKVSELQEAIHKATQAIASARQKKAEAEEESMNPDDEQENN